MPDMDTEGKKTILLVEDEAIIAMAEAETLRGFGYRVVTAHSGEKAVGIATGGIGAGGDKIDLILMDIDLGRGIDGTEAARRILAERTVPIVFLTSHSEKEYVDSVRQITRYGFVIKNSGEFVLRSSIEMAFELFEAHSSSRESEEQLSTTLESIGDAVVAVDRQGRVVLMNSVAERLTGWRADEARGLPLTELFHIVNALTRERCDNPVEQVLTGGIVVGLANHTVLIARDGTEYHIADSAAPIRDRDGGIRGVVLVFRDVSEEYRTQEALRESEERYRLLAHHMQQGLAVHEVVRDPAGTVVDYRFLDMNPFFESITGLKREALIGKTVRDVMPDTEPYWIEQYGRVAQTGIPLFYENYSQELKKYYRVVAYRLKPGQFATVATDITEHRTERSIIQLLSAVSEEFLRATPESLDYRFITDTARNLSGAQYAAFNLFEVQGKDFTTVAVSGQRDSFGRAAAMLGFEISGKRWQHDPVRAERTASGVITRFSRLQELTGSVLPVSLVQLLERSFGIGEAVVAKIAKDDVVIGDFTLLMPAGTAFSRSELVEVYCREVGLLLTRLRAEARVNSLLREKELLLREVHHRVKNNMNTMASLLSLQSDMVKEPAAASALKDAERRLRSMEVLYDRLYRSVNVKEMSIRDYLPPLVNDIVRSFPDRARIEVELQVADFMMDPKALSALGIIMNELITNSMKHAFTGRDSGRISVSAAERKRSVRITVQDDGIGIPRSVEMESSGGFGLHLVQMLMKQTDGTVRLDRGRGRGRGTKFVLDFTR